MAVIRRLPITDQFDDEVGSLTHQRPDALISMHHGDVTVARGWDNLVLQVSIPSPNAEEALGVLQAAALMLFSPASLEAAPNSVAALPDSQRERYKLLSELLTEFKEDAQVPKDEDEKNSLDEVEALVDSVVWDLLDET